MPSVDRLRAEWRKRRCLRAFEPVMMLAEDGLVLGTGTILAQCRRDRGGPPELAVDGAEERILALLSVAYRKAVDPGVLGNIRRASASWRDGETCLAQIHLVHAGLPPLAGDAAGYRLFAADRLLACGIEARDLLKACDIDTAALDLLKAGFDPDEPRVPAGNPDGGQWTDSEYPAGESGSSRPPHDLPPGAGEGTQRPLARPRRTISGVASWYSLPGRRMANGKIFDPNAMAAAMRTVPLGTTVIVQSAENPSRSIRVVITDRGPYARGRVIDLTPAAFRALFDRLDVGLGKVKVKIP